MSTTPGRLMTRPDWTRFGDEWVNLRHVERVTIAHTEAGEQLIRLDSVSGKTYSFHTSIGTEALPDYLDVLLRGVYSERLCSIVSPVKKREAPGNGRIRRRW